MTLEELLKRERELWGDNKQTLEHIAVCLAKMQGDIAAQARNKLEGKLVDESEVQKELGNFIASTVRWIDDLGYNTKDCIRLALASQQRYQK